MHLKKSYTQSGNLGCYKAKSTPDIRSSLPSLCKLNPNIIEPFRRIAFSKLKEGT